MGKCVQNGHMIPAKGKKNAHCHAYRPKKQHCPNRRILASNHHHSSVLGACSVATSSIYAPELCVGEVYQQGMYAAIVCPVWHLRGARPGPCPSLVWWDVSAHRQPTPGPFMPRWRPLPKAGRR
jgi:hypothetical protein